MRIDASLPKQRAALRIESVRVGVAVAEVDRVARASLTGYRADHGRAADHGAGLEGPVDAPAFRVERVDVAVVVTDEHAPAGDRRLRVRRQPLRVTESPLELQLRHVGRAEPGFLARLEARAREVPAPAVP